MAFENINVTSLKNALNSCKNSLDCTNSNSIISSISDTNVWSCDSQTKLKKSLQTLTNNRYKELKNTINNYLSVASLIEEYKQLEKSASNLQAEYNKLQKKLWYTETYTTTTTNSSGQTIEQTKTRQVKDTNIERKMQNNKKQYNSKINEMETKQKKIMNSI